MHSFSWNKYLKHYISNFERKIHKLIAWILSNNKIEKRLTYEDTCQYGQEKTNVPYKNKLEV